MSNDPHPPLSEDELLMNKMASLVSLAKAGDLQATESLFSQFRGYLLLIANEELGRDMQGKFGASDFVQETMLIAHHKFKQFRGETVEELKGWLRQILRNDLHRVRKKFSAAHHRDLRRELPIDNSDARINPIDHQLTPQSSALIKEEAKILEIAMSRLPENYRKAIHLREWEELSYPEIGKRMGTTEEAARKLCNRAMLKLEGFLKQVLDESQPTPEPQDNCEQ